MIDRVIPLTGIHNLRDYGGYAARGGGKLKTGLLWRSSQHVDANDVDLAAIAGLNLTTVIDLRGDSERESFPCARPAGFSAHIIKVAGETTGHAPHIEAAREVRTVADAFVSLQNGYANMPFRPQIIEIFRDYFVALSSRAGASLVHCLAGKDRTGVIVALFHHLMGVHSDDIMADYLLTNVAGNIEARIAAAADTVRRNFGPRMSDDAMRMLMSVQPEWLDIAFEAMRERHGSVEGYAAEVLGVTTDVLARIEVRVLA